MALGHRRTTAAKEAEQNHGEQISHGPNWTILPSTQHSQAQNFLAIDQKELMAARALYMR